MNYTKRAGIKFPSSLEPLDGELVRVEDVGSDQRDQMFDLMCRYYENMTRDSFDSDLDEKDWVILARLPRTRRLMGFSTQMLLDLDSGNAHDNPQRPLKILFSGDTIIDRRYWSRNPLAQLWGQLALTLVDKHCDHDLFWLLISKGFRTYRFLPVFFKEFYPRYDVETPEWADELIARIGHQRYPMLFDQGAGIVRANEFGCKLRHGIADVTQQRLEDKHVEYFNRINPGHVVGDELCCLAHLSRENFKRGAWRVIGEQVTVRL